MFGFIHKILIRFIDAIRGILHALRHDSSFGIQFLGGLIFISVFWYFMQPLEKVEVALLFFAWLLVLITELQNSAFESALDKLHPGRHEQIGKSKDMAAGSVFLAGIFALSVVLWIIFF